VIPGNYVVHAYRSGYVNPAPDGIRLKEGGQDRRVTVTANQVAENIHLSLVRGAVVAGRVLDPDGRPLPGMSVDARFPTPSSQNLDGEAYYLGAGETTNERGEFRIINLEPGKYAVSADSDYRAPQKSGEFAKTYFPHYVDIDDATVISLNSGEALEGLDITVQPPRKSFKVSGKIVDPRGIVKADSGITALHLIPLDKPGPHSNRTTLLGNESDERLEFEVHAFPGRYDLYVDIGDAVAGRATIDVRDSDLDGIAVSVGGVEVRGQVMVVGQVPRPLTGNPYLTLATADITTQPGKLDESGFFTIPEVINGVWKAQWASPQNNLVVADARQGSESVYDRGIVVNDPPDPIQIVLSPVGSIDGLVRDGKQQAVAGAHIVIVPAVGGIQRTSSDAAGRFAFEKVAVGEYRIYAMRASEFPDERILPTPSAVRTFLGRYAPQSRIAKILSGETVSVVTTIVEP
jgi:hypothetical protein